MHITLNDIKEAASGLGAYITGKEDYSHGHVGKINLSQIEDCLEVSAGVGNYNDYYECRAELYNNNIAWCECECLPSFEQEGACQHVIALLFKYYYEILPEMKRGLRGERYSQNVLAYYEDQLMREQELEIGEHPIINIKVKLMDEGEGRLNLGLSVGEHKFYIVKDLYEFTDNMLQGNNVAYGKNLEFIHDMSVFNEMARPIVQYIMDKTTEYLEVLRQVGLYRGFAKADRKTLPLSSKAFDEFFDLIRGTTLEVTSQGITREVLCIEGEPKLDINIDQEEDYYKLMTSLQHYVPINCAHFKYLLTEDKLYRLGEEFARDVFPLLNHMNQAERIHGEKKLDFDDALMKRFMLSSLNKIQKHVPVKMDEKVQKVAPERVQIRSFFDMDGHGAVIGDIEFVYEQLTFNPYKKATKQQLEILENIVRDVPNESRANNILKVYNFRTNNGRLYLEDEESIYKFLKQGLNSFLELGEVHVTEHLKQVNIVKSPVSSIGLKVESNMLHLILKDINMPMEEAEDILGAYKLKQRYYRLRNGSFLDMEEKATTDFINIVESLGLTSQDLLEGEVQLPKYRALYLDHILKESEEIEAQRDKYFKQIIRDIRNVEDADYEVPESIQAKLRGYQKIGYRWLRTIAEYGFGGILADDMGLGKTLQVITLIVAEKEKLDHEQKPSLVVCPTSLALNWESELKKFAPTLKVLVVMGTASERKELLLENKDYDVIITSYELLKRDIEEYEGIQFKYCIADEAQYIKNANTLSAKSLKLLQGEVRFALTGTPIENSLAELWSIFDFIMPGYLFNYTKFKRDYESPIVKNEDEMSTLRLKKMIAPFILRRLKKEVVKELPDKTETVIYNTMEETQANLYKAHLAMAKQEIEEEIQKRGAGGSHIKMLALLTRLRQLCCHPSLYLQDYNEGSGKLEQCMEIIRESIEGGHKILLFSQFTSMLALISKALNEEGIRHFTLTGATKVEERMRLVEEFNESDIPIFLISLKAGGTGLNLTGADVVIHYDPWWNISSQNQATDRAYRIGQKNKVQVFQMITKNSIEEKIKELQDKKVGLTESVLQDGEVFLNRMSENEIKELFSSF